MDSILSTREILGILPHRYPFLLVDKVISLELSNDPKTRVGQKIVALKNITFNEPYFSGHFPGLPIMPGVLQIEAMAQAACLAYVRKSDPACDFFIVSIQDAKFRRPVVPGDTLLLHAEIIRDRGQMLVVKTEAKVEGQIASQATIMAKVSPQALRDTP